MKVTFVNLLLAFIVAAGALESNYTKPAQLTGKASNADVSEKSFYYLTADREFISLGAYIHIKKILFCTAGLYLRGPPKKNVYLYPANGPRIAYKQIIYDNVDDKATHLGIIVLKGNEDYPDKINLMRQDMFPDVQSMTEPITGGLVIKWNHERKPNEDNYFIKHKNIGFWYGKPFLFVELPRRSLPSIDFASAKNYGGFLFKEGILIGFSESAYEMNNRKIGVHYRYIWHHMSFITGMEVGESSCND